MLLKILGAVLLVIGVTMAVGMVIGAVVAVAKIVLPIALVGGLLWGGWRLLKT